MQGKGIIKVFLVALTLVSIIQFLYVLPTNRVENAADRYAESIASQKPEAERRTALKNARASYLDSMSSETIFKLPLIKSYTYQDLKNSQLNFGLDLKGGMSVLLQVDLRDFIRALAGTTNDQTLEDVLAKTSTKQQSSQSDFITLFAETWKEVSPERPMTSIIWRGDTPLAVTISFTAIVLSFMGSQMVTCSVSSCTESLSPVTRITSNPAACAWRARVPIRSSAS